MGYYLNNPFMGRYDKALFLVEHHGAEKIPVPPVFEDVPEDKALVCVVENGHFDAAALIYSADEMSSVRLPSDGRRKTWLLMKKETAHQMAAYPE